MRTLARFALIIGATALCAACGGSQSPIGTPGTMSQSVSAPAGRALRAIYSFKGSPDGWEPISNLVAPKSVRPYPQLIGTTEYGGYYNAGTVYGLTKRNGSWIETVLYAYNRGGGTRPNGVAVPKQLDGTSPVFVTSYAGGKGYGAIAVLHPNPHRIWTLLSTYSFAGRPDGAAPYGPVIEDQEGNLYGTTSSGGAANDGTVYRLHPAGSTYTESVLYSFQGGHDGDHPYAGLVADNENAFYGTTGYGGSGDSGTVFKLTPSGSGYTESIVYSFHGPPDGSQPLASLCRDSSGTLYGTTELGGRKHEGTVFKLVPHGSSYSETQLWSFGNVGGDGANPDGGVIVDANGVIYGTTLNGGRTSGGPGTFFTLTPRSSGSTPIEKLYYFNGADGDGPYAGPTADDKGKVFIPASSAGAFHFYGAIARAPLTVGALACGGST